MAKAVFQRGFKAKAERLALEFREKLNLHACDPLSAFKLAEHLEIPICSPSNFFTNVSDIEKLCGTRSKDSGWSALTLKNESGKKIIIHNTNHSSTRQQSNVMHEIAHIICEHEIPTEYNSYHLPIGMRFFNEIQEAEANFLGAALLISRPAILWALKRNMSHERMGEYFNVSLEMVQFRLNATGAKRQLTYLKRSSVNPH